MGRTHHGVDQDSPADSKAKLVEEVCSIASQSIPSCAHRRRRAAAFVDWYLVLQIKDDAGSDVIRRRYRQLALQLHPDKNKHHNAEVAFKLLSEAYACLSDKARRKAFDNDRRNHYCKDCERKPPPPPSSTPRRRNPDQAERDAKPNCRMRQALNEVQNKLREECSIIESCLRSNRRSKTESPLFDPSDRQQFPNYPSLFRRHSDKWQFNPSVPSRHSYYHRQAQFESPVYQISSRFS